MKLKRLFSRFLSLLWLGCIFGQPCNGDDSETIPQPAFSVMRRVPPETVSPSAVPVQEPVSPGIITVKPADPISPEPAPEGGSVTPPPPPEPPASIGVAETEAPPADEAPPPSVKPLPETPSRISSQIEPKREEVSASRTIWAIVGQSIEIPFRGNGWVYLGEQENRQGMVYHSRRNELDGQKYVFRADSVGTYTLKFYRQDFIEDYIINEYVQVIVSENPVIAGTNRTQPVERDRAESGSSRAETAGSSGSSQAAAQDSIAGAASSAARADYLQQAKDAYTAGSFPEVITLLDQFRELYPAGTDEAWWLYAQSFEANSPSRNIRSALDYYRRLIQEYPQSPRGSEAQRRIAYLERYYFNIR